MLRTEQSVISSVSFIGWTVLNNKYNNDNNKIATPSNDSENKMDVRDRCIIELL